VTSGVAPRIIEKKLINKARMNGDVQLNISN
jgi:hypothetical protein